MLFRTYTMAILYYYEITEKLTSCENTLDDEEVRWWW